MKNVMSVCFAIAFLSLGISAQEDQFNNEFPENGYANIYENGTEAILMILEKESNLPVCQLSDQVRINSDFIPENRIGNSETTSTQDVRICQEEDVWEAALNDEEIVIAIAAPKILSLMSNNAVTIISFTAGSLLCDFFEEENNENKAWERFEENAYFGISLGAILHIVSRRKEFFPGLFGGNISRAIPPVFINPVNRISGNCVRGCGLYNVTVK